MKSRKLKLEQLLPQIGQNKSLMKN